MRRIVLVTAVVLAELFVIDQTTPQLTRGGGAFALENVPNDTVVAQEFAVTQRGLSRIDVPGAVAGTGQGHLDARLLRLGDVGEEAEIFSTTIRIAAGRPCCAVNLPQQKGSRGALYRLELRPRDLAAATRFDVSARSAIRAGGLIINGHRQAANLAIDADVRFDRLPGDARISLLTLATALTVITLTVLPVIAGLWRRPASA